MSLQRYRRGLLRALNEVAEEMVREGDLPGPEEVEWYRLPEGFFERHFALFNDLDRVCGVGADDHTVEEVEPERLERVILTLRGYVCREDRELEEVLDRMWGLCWRAKQAGRSVFFVL